MPNYIRKNTEKIENYKFSEELDVEKLAGLLSYNLKNMLCIEGSSSITKNQNIIFDDSKTLDRLADKISDIKSDNKSNFNNLGNVVESKKDENEVDSTINLLRNIDD